MDAYNQVLRSPVNDESKRAVVGPFPRIIDVEGQSSESLQIYGTNLLALSDQEEAQILPSLDISELLEKLKLDRLEQITLVVGVNSDSYNRGLGVTLKSDAVDPDKDEDDWYEYGGGRSLQGGSNAIKFHPGMGGGQLRIEGAGGFGNTDIGFTPPSWSSSRQNLTMFEITLGHDGSNSLTVRSASGDERDTWTGTWDNKLIQGTRIPAVFAHVDLGGEDGKPLMIGQVSLRMETSASRALTFFREYSVAMSKAIAGLLRLLLEDVAQAACQLVYMIKQWQLMSLSAKAFTILSVTTGVVLSIIGPISELRLARMARQKAAEAGQEGDIGLEESPDKYIALTQVDELSDDGKAKPLLGSTTAHGSGGEQHVWTRTGVGRMPTEIAEELGYPKEGAPLTDLQLSHLAEQGIDLHGLIQEGIIKMKKDQPRKEEKAEPKNVLTLRNIPIEDLLVQKGRGLRHVSRSKAYPLLMFSSVSFWALMLILPFLLNNELSCDGGPPAIGMYLFFAHTCFDLLIQLWICVQTRHGFILFAQLSKRFWLGVGFTCLCRFDTFGDVINTAKLFQCEPITWVSVRGRVFTLPFGMQLANFALITLVVGVFIAQALPGLLLLYRKTYLPIALKLNEFNLLLAVMLSEVEDVQFAIEDDSEKAS